MVLLVVVVVTGGRRRRSSSESVDIILVLVNRYFVILGPMMKEVTVLPHAGAFFSALRHHPVDDGRLVVVQLLLECASAQVPRKSRAQAPGLCLCAAQW